MIVLDTHIWVWWIHGDKSLKKEYFQLLDSDESGELGISAISCWEVAKLVEYKRLELPCSINEWVSQALAYPNNRLLNLTPVVS